MVDILAQAIDNVVSRNLLQARVNYEMSALVSSLSTELTAEKITQIKDEADRKVNSKPASRAMQEGFVASMFLDPLEDMVISYGLANCRGKGTDYITGLKLGDIKWGNDSYERLSEYFQNNHDLEIIHERNQSLPSEEL